ncbi:MAG: Clp protease N-terminal domain-containing protein [Gemmatimonadaceae bacterium]
MRDHPFFSAELLALLAAGEREARRLGHTAVENRHLLLALGVTEKQSLAREALAQLEVDESALRAGVAQSIDVLAVEKRGAADEPLSYTLSTKRALEHAMSEAHLAGRHPVDTGYLLLGMLHQPDDPAAIALSSAGATLEEMRRVLLTTRA